MNEKFEKALEKEATEKMDLPKKSVEKMQARGKTCFLQHTRNTTHSKLRKGARKMQPQMKHTNTTTTPKCNSAPRDDDTRCRPRPVTSSCRPEALAWRLVTFDQWETTNT